MPRVLGHLRSDVPGPTLIAIGGIHGNEPAGVRAIRAVLAAVAATGPLPCGEIVGLSGNRGGLEQGARYVSKDLNRLWTPAHLAALHNTDRRDLDDAEDAEQRGLHAEIEAAIGRARGPVLLLDLHTTSAPGLPFVLLSDTPAQRALAAALHVPALLGLEVHVLGAISTYYGFKGCVACSVEGGQHQSDAAFENLAAALWAALAHAGVLEPALAEARHGVSVERLRTVSAGVPRLLHVRSRRAIEPSDEFVMEPGFLNLAPVRRGHLLARDRHGEIRAESDGVVILPLYQKLGSEGFFWGESLDA